VRGVLASAGLIALLIALAVLVGVLLATAARAV